MKLILENWKRYTEALGDKKQSTHNELLAQKALEQAGLTNEELIYSLLVSINSGGEFKDGHKKPVDEESLKTQIPELSKFVNYFVSTLNLFGIEKDSLNKIKFSDLDKGMRAFRLMWDNYIEPDNRLFTRGLEYFLQISNLANSAKISDEILNQYYNKLGLEISDKESKQFIKNILTKIISQAPESTSDSTELATDDIAQRLKNKSPEQKVKILAQAAKEVTNQSGISNEEAASEVVKDISPDASDDVIQAVVDSMNKSPSDEEKPAEEESTKTTATGETIEGENVEVGDQTFTVVQEEYPEVQDAYKEFKDKFLTVRLLRDQDALIGNLRGALSRFLGLEGPDDAEVALRREAEGQDTPAEPEAQSSEEEPTKAPEKPKADVSKAFGSLKTDVARLRRDLNDSLQVLKQYEQKSKKGVYAAELVLKRLKKELTDVQDSNRKVIIDLTKLAPDYEFRIDEAQEESREQKIANVEKSYDDIIRLMDSIINQTLPDIQDQPEEPKDQPEESDANQDYSKEQDKSTQSNNTKTVTNNSNKDANPSQVAPPIPEPKKQKKDYFEEQIYRKVLRLLIEQDEVDPQSLEIESFVQIASEALKEINKIKKYFRVTGTFSKPLPKIKKEFGSLIKGYQKTLSDLVVDVRQQKITTDNIQKYIEMFTTLTSKIIEYFGIYPREPISIKKPDGTVETIPSSASSDSDNTPAVSDAGEDSGSEEPQDKPESLEDLFTQVRKFVRSPQTTQFMEMSQQMVDELSKPAPGTQELLRIVNTFRSKMTGPLEEQLSDEQMGARFRELKSLIDELRKNFTKSSPKLFVKSIQQDNRKYAGVYKAYFEQAISLYKNLFMASKSFIEKAPEKAEKFLAAAEEGIARFGQDVVKVATDSAVDILDSLADMVPDFFGIENVKNIDFGSKPKPDDSLETGEEEDPDNQQTEVDPEAVTLADPTQLMNTEISDLTANIKKYAPTRGPVKQEVARALIEKDEQFKDYYARFLALLSGLNAMRQVDNEKPEQIKKVITDIYSALHSKLEYGSQQLEEQSEPPSIFKLQQLTLKMFLMLKDFTTETTEGQLQPFYMLYQKALPMVRNLKNYKSDLKYDDNDDELMTVLNNTEYFRPNARMIGTQATEIVPDEENSDYNSDIEVPEPDQINKDKRRKKQKATAKEKGRQQNISKRSKTKRNSSEYNPERSTRYMGESKENLLERLIKEELKVLNGKKMVCN
ncbi:hypothetical protein N9W68_00590 [Candidatus Pelagibacter bacterium]|nr:hypothetical protein [Candidatus Pelagibacter bacterium]